MWRCYCIRDVYSTWSGNDVTILCKKNQWNKTQRHLFHGTIFNAKILCMCAKRLVTKHLHKNKCLESPFFFFFQEFSTRFLPWPYEYESLCIPSGLYFTIRWMCGELDVILIKLRFDISYLREKDSLKVSKKDSNSWQCRCSGNFSSFIGNKILRGLKWIQYTDEKPHLEADFSQIVSLCRLF